MAMQQIHINFRNTKNKPETEIKLNLYKNMNNVVYNMKWNILVQTVLLFPGYGSVFLQYDIPLAFNFSLGYNQSFTRAGWGSGGGSCVATTLGGSGGQYDDTRKYGWARLNVS